VYLRIARWSDIFSLPRLLADALIVGFGRHCGEILNGSTSRALRERFHVVRMAGCSVNLRVIHPMKKVLLVAGILVAVFTGDSAFAADMPVKAPPIAMPVASPAGSWTGLYIGGDIGGGWADPKATTSDTIESGCACGPSFLSPTSFNLHSSGVVGGAHAGYNYQFAPTWVAGVEADWNATSLKASGTFGPISESPNFAGGIFPGIPGTSTSDSVNIKDVWSIRGRIGYAQPTWMLYVTGGFAEANASFNGNLVCAANVCTLSTVQATASFNGVRNGWVAGTGVEYRLNNSWIVGVEYLFYDFSDTNTGSAAFVPAGSGGSCGAGQACVHYAFGDFNMQSLRFRLSYKFN
jgi:outer membrane immunogenic protein